MSRPLPSRILLGLALATLAACAPAPASSTAAVPVRADLVLIPDASPDDPSLLVAQYREWDASGRRIPGIELDHGHGPDDEEVEDEQLVFARVGGQELPIQAVDAVGDRVIVDLDALPMGRQTLTLRVVHDGLASDELVISVLDRRTVP